jgi:hypothetical protein
VKSAMMRDWIDKSDLQAKPPKSEMRTFSKQ